ncbi:MGDG synthase family glycosyltransferase [Bacillus sp. PS06]|uniref:MGDG synthase family glycosyltransferase n=1 Tax=Bacillus sp. PS06 TaxID=2764176 RepID=UPI001782077B|nr:glycosyltransferase [Bacillus sp. PS06]MBD8068063.1 UDP-glucuronosyltransferase [Bacillus sp. PS06]
MKKVLFMPFLQIPSGHHQVADAIAEIVSGIDSSIDCDKVDILSYSYGNIEQLISTIYLKWIHTLPKTYHWLYQTLVCKDMYKDKNYKLYELLFLPFVKKLIREKQPDIIVSSHALPSYMLNKLKQLEIINTPVINVYTDFFIHSFWGTKHIDYHFVGHPSLKKQLVEKGISEEKIYVTGIPTHPFIKKEVKKQSTLKNCLIMGGSLGVGMIEQLLPKLRNSKHISFYILCGKNKKLYDKVQKLADPNIHPYGYISDRKKMNDIYEKADLVITKPGGITISECLTKEIPTLIYHSLPGQEKINLNELSSNQLVFQFEDWQEMESIEDEILSYLQEKEVTKVFAKSLKEYQLSLDNRPLKSILHQIIYS